VEVVVEIWPVVEARCDDTYQWAVEGHDWRRVYRAAPKSMACLCVSRSNRLEPSQRA
jgi:hypothetical protein